MIKFRETQILSLYGKIKRLQNDYVDLFEPHFEQAPLATETLLRSEYGGEQFHLKSNEPTFMKIRYGYIDFNNNCTTNQTSCSQPASTETADQVQAITKRLFESLTLGIPKNNIPKLMGRYCDARCNIPNFWASRLFVNLQTIYPVSNFKLLQNNIVNFETCSRCNQSTRNQCIEIQHCNDNFRNVLELSKHYQGIRTLSRLLYQIRSLNLLLIHIDQSILQGNLIRLIELTEFKSAHEIRGPIRFTLAAAVQPVNYDRIKEFKAILAQEMDKQLISIECLSCQRLFTKERVRLVKSNYLLDPIFQQLAFNYTGSDYYICREQCFKQLFVEKKIPSFSPLNNMFLNFPPKELTGLNIYEKMLIQLGKCYQNIFRSQLHRKCNGVQPALALKGISIHLPLNFTETHGYLVKSLPNTFTRYY